MIRPFPVIDADGHVIERDRELREFLPDSTGGAQGKRRWGDKPPRAQPSQGKSV
jgi:hypothetical protein